VVPFEVRPSEAKEQDLKEVREEDAEDLEREKQVVQE
jgi:hypothetical protein